MEEFKTIVGNKQRNPHRGSIDGIAPTITAACGAGGGMTPMLTDATIEETKTTLFIEQMRGHMEQKKQINLPDELKNKRFRIRKLTPRECFRLMGVADDDIDKIQGANISNSNQYKLAGNSIVSGGVYRDDKGNWDGVLYNLFRKMFIETSPDIVKGQAEQLTLF